MAIVTADKLAVYNGALRRLGSRRIASLTEAREPRRVLDDVWGAADETPKYALARGEWNFAMRAVEADYSPSVEPEFGFRRAYDKPDDFVRLAAMASDEYFHNTLTALDYTEEQAYWLTDCDVLYIRYVSSGVDYGLDSLLWSPGFKRYLECFMAWEACERITNSQAKKDRLEREMRMALRDEKSSDAMQEGAKFPPTGSWVRARGSGGRKERSRL